MIIRIYQRVRAYLLGLFFAVWSKLVPSALDRAVKAFTAAEGLLTRAASAAEARLEQERRLRSSLREARDASYDRSDSAYADKNRAIRIRKRLSNLLD